ncbi:hypothetical protein [Xanthocytophaga flava]|uniref:hypothetical protein n=1 Tax=Xanthocytophaga flava TaxID=3048013 RepID=UPI0028D82733|nr:hypothetical protein [Xanthocytophaga flavus]MDJ1468661.1 hypothetical protein [Xanthocytophaga flavus]
MGLDIFIHTKPFIDPTAPTQEDHRLSRYFCNLMCLWDINSDLKQIEDISGIDLLPLYHMLQYVYLEEDEIEFYLEEEAVSKSDRRGVLRDIRKGKKILENNIDKVLQTVTELIEKLNQVENLPWSLASTYSEYMATKENSYFSHFTIDTEDIDKGKDNNFGQDLRNLKRFLEYAKKCGVTTVWFDFG